MRFTNVDPDHVVADAFAEEAHRRHRGAGADFDHRHAPRAREPAAQRIVLRVVARAEPTGIVEHQDSWNA
ncbi:MULTISPECIES: hypothetical protein [unclassified Burkholderia]|uniref:hypothetical protein n=1 Tax=unclassified Burkholderia TaxID=2613784 RepID=UPI001E37137B|nr:MULTISPECIES: hypothetical protein [unclassified Burkholderia]